MAIPDSGADTNVLLTRSPLSILVQALKFLARLACVRRTASVHSELGSNSFKRKKCKYLNIIIFSKRFQSKLFSNILVILMNFFSARCPESCYII